MRLTKEMYHFILKYPKRVLWDFLSIFLPMSGVLVLIVAILDFIHSMDLSFFIMAILIEVFISFLIATVWVLIGRSYGEDVSNDEFILYENGWFVFWNAEKGWIAPAKIDWLLPPVKNKKELEKKVGYKINGWYGLQERYYIFRKRGNYYKGGFGLIWTYPTRKWENWIFGGDAEGYLTEEEYKKFLEMIEYLDRKAKENIESGRIKIPEKNMKQEHIEYYQLPQYWNEVFQKENIRELYRKETGEDIPEPVRSFLFDYDRYKNVYLKNKREIGDWFGRKRRDNYSES